ncbi:arsenical pump membrane protein [Salmonella enterica subsp. enterica serovar Heidelberg str. N653]|nr:arsenical pump membrane protein [Salmonella enterica subsp. enterica serovar Heidelberg str. N653]
MGINDCVALFANADSELILTPIIIAVLLAPGFSKSTTLAILHFFFRREK